MTKIDMKHSSRKAWSTLNRLTGRKNSSIVNKAVSANSVAKCLVNNGKYKEFDKEFTREVNRKLKEAWQTPSVDQDLCSSFSTEEVEKAIQSQKLGKSPGPDGMHPEFYHYLHENCISWLTTFYSTCLTLKRIPKIWRKAKVVAILKPHKPADVPTSYRPVSLLCIAFKVMERLILNRIESVVDSQLPHEQAGFRAGRSTLDQVCLLTEDIESAFLAKEKAGAVLVDLSAAYDTVWHRGLTLKLLQTIPSKEMVHMILEMITNRGFTLHLSDDISKPRRLVNGVPQGSVLAPMLFNIYTADLPTCSSQRYIYADDIALLFRHKSIDRIEKCLSNDLNQLKQYFHHWRLKLNTTKTVSSVFHLANRLAHRELKVTAGTDTIPFERNPKYLGVTLDRSLTYKEHLRKTTEKVRSRSNLLRRLASNRWGASFDVLQTSALSLCYSAAEYCAPAWSASSHVPQLDAALNDSMRLITGCIRSTSSHILPILSGIPPPETRREGLLLKVYNKAFNTPTHLLHNIALAHRQAAQRLPSRNPLSSRMIAIAHKANDVPPDQWIAKTWLNQWNNTNCRLKQYVPMPSTLPPGHDLPRQSWVLLNRLRSGYGRYADFMHRIGLAQSDQCFCGERQTPDHVLTCRTIDLRGDLKSVDEELRQWLLSTDLNL